MAATTVSLSLLVDRKKNRVVFAESGKDFVDILFSFLTLPMGTIIRILNKQSSVGCIDNLYQSVENIDKSYLETEACKTMLLQPRSAAERLCEDLLINVDDLEPRRLYRCSSFDCVTKTHRAFSTIFGARCPCGETMDKRFKWIRGVVESEADVFMKGERKYMISDDLNILPAAMSNALPILEKLDIDADDIEQLNVDLHREEVLVLLKRLLLSKTPLTDVFLRKTDLNYKTEDYKTNSKCKAEVKLEEVDDDDHETTHEGKGIVMKVIRNKFTKKVLYAEMGGNSVDVLLCFLTFPLGTVVKLLNKNTSVGCIDNLYKSVEILMAGECMKSEEEVENMLLSPKLSPHFNCSNQILPIEVELSMKGRSHGCELCWQDSADILDKKCKHKVNVVYINEINPKLPNSGTECGGGYAKRSTIFMVTDQLAIKPCSVTIGFQVIKELKVPIRSLEEIEVTLGVTEVLNLLKGCLISQNVLNYVFSQNKLKKLH